MLSSSSHRNPSGYFTQNPSPAKASPYRSRSKSFVSTQDQQQQPSLSRSGSHAKSFMSRNVGRHSRSATLDEKLNNVDSLVDESHIAMSGVDGSDGQNSDALVRMLCDYQDGFEWMLNRVKLDINSSRDVISYMDRRAAIEEDYAKKMMALSQQMLQDQAKKQGKEGSFAFAWTHLLNVTESIGKNRENFAHSLNNISNELNIVRQDAERSRKQLKDAGFKYQKQLSDADAQLMKAKAKYEQCTEDLERSRFQHQRSSAFDQFSTHSVSRKKSINPLNLFQKKKTEEDFWRLHQQAVETLKYQIANANQLRQEYYATHLPYLIKSLKDTNDECDLALQALLLKFSATFEESILADATHVSPLTEEGMSLKKIVGQIDNSKDFLDYIRQFLSAASKVDHDPIKIGADTEPAKINNQNFGVAIEDLVYANGNQVPEVLQKCIEYIESQGLRQRELYRMNGSQSHVQTLRNMLDTNQDQVDFTNPEWRQQVHTIATVVKQFFKELPEPLLTHENYQRFLNAVRLDAEAYRLQGIHAVVNDLPDANYVVLRYLAGHLARVSAMSSANNMTTQQLALVFGPILMGTAGHYHQNRSDMLKEMQEQCRVVEIIIDGFSTIFEA